MENEHRILIVEDHTILREGLKAIIENIPNYIVVGEAGDGILGLVVNQTISTNGYEFYRMFYLLWSEKPDSLKYSLNVQEKLSKQRGNQVIVYLGQKVIFSGVLPLKYEQLKELSTKAAEETQANLVMLLLEPTKDADIDSDQV